MTVLCNTVEDKAAELVKRTTGQNRAAAEAILAEAFVWGFLLGLAAGVVLAKLWPGAL